MRIQYCSDLHLEFSENWRWLQQKPLLSQAEILLIAGDTYYLGENFAQHPFFDIVSEAFEQVFLIPGNHEFYRGFDINLCLQESVKLEIRPNVHLVNNIALTIEDVEFIFTTLWSKIVHHPGPIMNSLNDFHLIYLNDRKLSLNGYNSLFEYAYTFLQKTLGEKKRAHRIVVTHHLPSELCNVKEFHGSQLNEAFCVELTNFIETTDVDYWIYAHSHRNKKSFQIGNTTMLTNQLGYVRYAENYNFNREAVLHLT